MTELSSWHERISRHPLTVLACLNVLFHVIGLVFAAVAMGPGTPLVSLSERMAYLAGAPVGWILGWICWMFCAVLLIAFLAVVTHRLDKVASLVLVGLMIAVAGLAFDIFCDSIYIWVFPMVASWEHSEQLFLVMEKVTSIGSLVIANGAYSVAILIFSVALRLQGGFRSLTVWVGYATGAAGLVMAAAGFTGSTQLAKWATPPTIGLFCVWVVLVARSMEPSRRTS